MTENVRTFEKALRESGELRRRLAQELKKIAEEKSAESDAEAMAKAAQALGYDFTVADMEKANAEAQELAPEEMEQAAGGWCFADYDYRQPGAGASQITTATPPGTTILLISRVPPASAITAASPCSMIPKWMISFIMWMSLSIMKMRRKCKKTERD